jgi:hypothetical protein
MCSVRNREHVVVAPAGNGALQLVRSGKAPRQLVLRCTGPVPSLFSLRLVGKGCKLKVGTFQGRSQPQQSPIGIGLPVDLKFPRKPICTAQYSVKAWANNSAKWLA